VWSYRVQRNGRIVDRFWTPLPSIWYVKRLWRLGRQSRRHSFYAKRYPSLERAPTQDDKPPA
jgi:hypothetical protein